MAGEAEKTHAALWPGLIALAAATGYLIALLAAENQALIISLLTAGIAAVIAAAWLRLLNRASRSFEDHEDVLGGFAILAAFAVAVFFHEDHLFCCWSPRCCSPPWRPSA